VQRSAKLEFGFLYFLVLGFLVAADVRMTSSLTIIPSYAQSTSSIAGGVQKKDAPVVTNVLQSLGITIKPTEDKGLLARVVPETTNVDRKILLLKGDRMAFFAVVESPDVRTYFTSLKEALQNSFSPQMRDLVDVTEAPEGHPIRNILSFVDPTLSEEKLIFVRSRDRLYEIHVAAGKDNEAQQLVEKLTE
jgi:hypothetical protein